MTNNSNIYWKQIKSLIGRSLEKQYYTKYYTVLTAFKIMVFKPLGLTLITFCQGSYVFSAIYMRVCVYNMIAQKVLIKHCKDVE